MPEKKRKRRTASLRHENEYFAQGYHHIFGLDEVGRGALAGPVTVGAVCLPVRSKKLRKYLEGVRDSKEMTPRQRALLVENIKKYALAWGVGSVPNTVIDETDIVSAIKQAMKLALDDALSRADIEPDCFFLDSLLWPEMAHIPQVSIVEGDKRSLTIAAASVLAKTWRDEFMINCAPDYPVYDFAAHKGYGTSKHFAEIKAFGPSDLHRMTFKPMASPDDNG
ncbi:MAG: ribonuclease HII [Phototrophicales bacterium]|nr:MAG: ribonuclease HII [Phototrophicales bacterium]